MVSERAIRRKFGEKIYRRGVDYFERGRVLSVAKVGGELVGMVSGTREYETRVGLKGLTCECSCPYHGRCKHGVALLLSYLDGEFTDGDEFTKRVRKMGEEELRNLVEKVVRSEPLSLLDFMVRQPEKGGEVGKEEVESWVRKIGEQYWNEEAVAGFSKFIRSHRKVLKKSQLFRILEFLFNNSGRMGWFYDDYADRYFGDQLFESIGEAFGETGLSEDDVAKLERMRRKDDMGYFDSIVRGIIENPENIDPDPVERFSTPRQLAEFHINRKNFDKAERIIERGDIYPEDKFELFLEIDEDKAQDFAGSERLYGPLIRLHYENGDEDGIRKLLPKMDKGELREISEEELEILFETCEDEREKILEVLYSKVMEGDRRAVSYELCGELALELGDMKKAKNIFEKTNSGELKKRIVKFLSESEPEIAEKYGKEAVGWIINEKKNYEPAVECIIILRKTMDESGWEDYMKDIYRENWRKRGLWEKLEDEGIKLRKRKDEVYFEFKDSPGKEHEKVE